jgi:hypothetical protein
LQVGSRPVARIIDFITLNRYSLNQRNFEYITKHKSKSFADTKQRITYSFNDVENTIIGQVEEDGNYICLYEYRGKYIGTEFLISFSKYSVSYKLINVEEKQDELVG